MTLKTKLFFCVCCNNAGLSLETIEHNNCTSPYSILEADIIVKKKLKLIGRFFDWFFSRNLKLFFAFIGWAGVNGVMIHHFQFSHVESLVESFFWGLIIPAVIMESE